ncbi:hypothetical protein U9M48_040679 [Paspalum notatum var. saurae]|uniref:Uncharacterized protein n=1 Tax=Paspalum notatum var. saurae TaxID=547442 RepID=A0AAQ3XEH3_PASNO
MEQSTGPLLRANALGCFLLALLNLSTHHTVPHSLLLFRFDLHLFRLPPLRAVSKEALHRPYGVPLHHPKFLRYVLGCSCPPRDSLDIEEFKQPGSGSLTLTAPLSLHQNILGA